VILEDGVDELNVEQCVFDFSFEGYTFMPRPERYAGARPVSVDADLDVYRKLKLLLEAQCKTVSDKLMRRRLAELEGSPTTRNVVDYEEPKRRYQKVVEDGKRSEANITKTKEYDETSDLADRVELDFENLSKLEEMVPQLLISWQGSPDVGHNSITLLEMGKQASKRIGKAPNRNKNKPNPTTKESNHIIKNRKKGVCG